MMVGAFTGRRRGRSCRSPERSAAIVLNGGVLDLSDFATWQSGHHTTMALQSAAAAVRLSAVRCGGSRRGRQFAYRRRRERWLYVVIDAGDGLVSLANNNSYWAPRKSLPVRWW